MSAVRRLLSTNWRKILIGSCFVENKLSAKVNEILNFDLSVWAGPVSRFLYSTAVGMSNRLLQWMTWPTVSMPLRPARPAICVYSCGYSIRIPDPLNFVNPVKITVFVGILMPTANVSVANSSLINPFSNMSSTISRRTGIMPAWWIAIPFSSREIISRYSGKLIYSK